jgi:hypothetical protein
MIQACEIQIVDGHCVRRLVAADSPWPSFSVRNLVMMLQIGRALRFGGVLSLALLAAGWSSPAKAQVKLEHKYVPGSKQVVHTTMKIKQVATIAGINQDTESDRFIITSSEVSKPDAEGHVRVVARRTSCQPRRSSLGESHCPLILTIPVAKRTIRRWSPSWI